MDSFEFNKIAGAVLGIALAFFGLGALADLLFHTEAPAKPGYIIESTVKVAAKSNADNAKPAFDSSLNMMASMELARGKKVAKKCSACHSYEEGGATKTGPNLWDIVNRPIGGVAGYGYSKAMKEFGQGKNWTFDELDHFIENPKSYIKGTKMGYKGIKKAKDRAALLLYLGSLSDNPAPLPGS